MFRFRRLTLTAAASLAALTGAVAAAPAVAAPAHDAGPVAAADPVPAADPAPVPVLVPRPVFVGFPAPQHHTLPAPDRDFGRDRVRDRLTVEVVEAGGKRAYTLECGPAGGDHPEPQAACDRLEELTAEGGDPFAPTSPDALCTMQHGGDATARVTGTWHGRPVDASYDRHNGCEISRWNAMGPVLLPAGA